MAKKKNNTINAFLLTRNEIAPEAVKENNNRDEYLLKIIDEVFSRNDIELKTDLTANQILKITKGQLYAETYKCKIMDSLCNKIMTLSVSKDRKSRGEFTEISKSINNPVEYEEAPSLKKRFMGVE